MVRKIAFVILLAWAAADALNLVNYYIHDEDIRKSKFTAVVSVLFFAVVNSVKIFSIFALA